MEKKTDAASGGEALRQTRLNLLDLPLAEAAAPARLEELRLGKEPTPVVFFRTDCETVALHYEKHEAIKGFFQCPGPGCPYCRFDKKPTQNYLLPVFHLVEQAVRVLRMPDITLAEGRRDPHALLPQVLAILRSGRMDNSVVLLTKESDGPNRTRHGVEVRTVTPSAMGDLTRVDAFNLEYDKGAFDLAAAYPRFTLEELAQVPTIAEKARRSAWIQALGAGEV